MSALLQAARTRPLTVHGPRLTVDLEAVAAGRSRILTV